MAVRSPKITRDVFNSCKQFVNFKSDIASISCSRSHVKNVSENDTTSTYNDDQEVGFRYVVSNTQRPEILPKIEFPKEPEQLIPPEMRHLQPSMLPKFMELREDPENTKWKKISEELTPFPEPVKELRTETITVSDKQKADLKLPNTFRIRFGSGSNIHKNLYTNRYLIPTRSMASHGSGGKKKKDEYDHQAECEQTPSDMCNREKTGCPKFTLSDCPEANRPSDCVHRYIDPKCKKKNAPYPSYSESCAERLEGDPSECFQCPWHKCGLAENIKPQNRRRYHRMVSAESSFTPSTVSPLYSPTILDLDYECDASKKPCERPMGKCEQEKEYREREKRRNDIRKIEESRHIHKDKTKHFSITDGLFAKDRKRRGKLPFNENLGDYDYVRKRKCDLDDKCKKKPKKQIVPDGCYSDNCKKCDGPNYSDNSLLLSSDLNYVFSSGKNRKDDCPPIEIIPVPVNRDEDPSLKPEDSCCLDERKGMKLTERKKRKRPKVTTGKRKNE